MAKDESMFELIKDAVREVASELDLVSKKDLIYLPNKDEFYTETLKIYKRFDDIETELEILNHRVSDHSDRVDNLEKIHPHSKHYLNVSTD